MGIHYHRARRADVLADGLAELLGAPPSDPFAAEIVAVPTRGVERFLSQRLALRLGARNDCSDGICANVEFPSPAELFASLSADLLAGLGDAPANDAGAQPPGLTGAWHAQSLTWAIAHILPNLAGRPECEALKRHLTGPPGSPESGRLLATAGRVARLLTQYEDERPQLVASWISGTPEVPADCRWQVLVWQELVRQLGPGPALMLPHLVARCSHDPDVTSLPHRLSVFGATRLSATALELLGALGRHREIHLWLIDPSPASWGAPPQHQLLASHGRDFAGLGARLRAIDHTEDCLPTPPPPNTLLGHLQADIAANVPARPRFIDPTDRSLQIHACYGSARQVDVAREVILGLLNSDSSLEPRDILVMCPDLDSFAPLFSAAFAATPSDPAIAGLRLRIADRTPEQANEVLAALAQALDLLAGRVTIGALLDLAASPAVARRFQLDEDGLARMRELAQGAGICWGLDATTRARYGMSGIDLGTWAFGLDRILLGVALGEDDLATFGGVLPLDDVGSSDLELVGAMATIVATLHDAQRFLSGMHPLADWVHMLTELARTLAAPPQDGEWMASHAETVLRAPLMASVNVGALHSRDRDLEVQISAVQGAGPASVIETPGPGPQPEGSAGEDTPLLAFGDIRWLLSATFAGRPTRANFRTGGLTVAGLVPMRSVPHRVIVLVGLDDGVFPRDGLPDGDDLLARDPQPGERNVRTEDRQLFLDAIMAAEEHLIITYCGTDDRTNEERPPAVPVAELLDVLAVMVGDAGTDSRARLVTHHPLQPFDPRNFIPGALVPGRAFSHDRSALAGAIAAAGDRVPSGHFLPAPLPEVARQDAITIADLSGFLADPLAYFLRNRLGLPTRGHAEPPPERLPVPLSGLAAWVVGDRLLDGMRHGHPPEALVEVERLRGALPPGELGNAEIRTIGPKAGSVYDRVLAFSRGPVDMVRVDLRLPNGVRLTGTVAETVMPATPAAPGAASGPALILRSSYSKFKPGNLLALWVALLAAQLSRPELTFAGVLVARDDTHALAAPDPRACVEHLTVLCDLLTAGWCEPLPMPPAPAHAYARARRQGCPPESATATAERSWSSHVGRVTESAATRIFGPNAPLTVLTGSPPHTREIVAGEDNRFAALSRLVWDPVLAAAVDVDSLVSGGSL